MIRGFFIHRQQNYPRKQNIMIRIIDFRGASMKSTFLAWITRMPLIKRWSLMHSFREENISEHSHMVAVIAHLICSVSNEYFGTNLNADKASTLALFHEISETKLQDLNSKTKYQTPEFTRQFKILEHIAETECVNTLPKKLRRIYAPLIIQDETDEEYRRIVKYADVIAAYVKTLEEQRFNNNEFAHVRQTMHARVTEICSQNPAVKMVVDTFISSCICSLDELTGIDRDNGFNGN